MKKTRAYYQYFLDKCDGKVGWYSPDDIEQIVYDLLEEGDVEEAMRACQMGLDQHPDDEYLVLIEAKVLVHMGRFDEAERLMKGKEQNNNPLEIGMRFCIMAGNGEVQKAFDYLNGLLKGGNFETVEYVGIIDEAFEMLPKEEMAQNLIEAAKFSIDQKRNGPRESEALGRIGAILMDCYHHKEAIPILEKALDQDAYDVFTWQDLSRCQLELKMYDKCLNSCEMGLAIDPKNPLFNFSLGFIRYQKGDSEGCIEPLEVARAFAEGRLKHENINLDRTEIEQHVMLALEILGAAYSELNRYKEAIECYNSLIKRNPANGEYFMKLATLHMCLGNSPRALTAVEKGIERSPDYRELKVLHVALLTELHKYEQALEELDSLLKLEPKSKTFLMAKAQMCLAIGKLDEADTSFRKLLKLKPKDESTRGLLRTYFESINDEEALKKLEK